MAATKQRSGNADGHRRLVIVESPAKARTIAGFLGGDYVVESSIGHIRDLPSRASDVPASAKGQPWARLGVDVENDFSPLYVITPDKRQQVAKLRKALAGVEELYLATDEDREGEAIAWHLVEVLEPSVPVRRMVFHEITRHAIEEAVAHPRDIDRALVDAQETRRILDRLYGYEVSPVLWKKVMRGLSAGRVQSVATRILVDRERARIRFRAASYWDVEGTFRTEAATSGAADATPDAARDPDTFTATLVSLGGQRVATGRDFAEDGTLRAEGVRRLDEPAALALVEGLAGAEFTVSAVEQRPYRRAPYPPFMTSTLQQEAGRKLRFSSQTTMRVAQRLYENGYITYMRTDSTTLSETALDSARAQARELFGANSVPAEPRRYEKRVKNAQEAHEAIRPAGDSFRTPRALAGELSGDELRLYELIWQRTIASQMVDATGRSVTVRVAGTASDGTLAEFATSGRVLTDPGFLRAYVEGSDDPDAELDDRERRLPDLTEGQALQALELRPQPHTTTPPPRFTEASLVKALEEMGVGRPSTYAGIIATIQDRGYVTRRGQALVPSFTAFAVVGLLERHFARLVDYNFTAEMEDDLDAIAAGTEKAVPWLTRFYFGSPTDGSAATGLRDMVSKQLSEIDAREVNSIPVGEGPDGAAIVVRVGRYGPFVQSGDARASVPDELAPDEFTVDKALELLNQPEGDRDIGTDPATGERVVARVGRYGPYVAALPADGDGPSRTASLLRGQSPDSLTLEEALQLLALPRQLGPAPDGEEVSVHHGRYGPYVRKGNESRSLEDETQLFTIGLDEALQLLSQPRRRGRTGSNEPLRELGADPSNGRPVQVKEGRFGPYVTDGETNASLRKGDTVADITLDRAAELLADRRARGPAAPRRRTRKG